MCTVTFLPTAASVVFTSNRDEKNLRAGAIPPASYIFPSGPIVFPKDGAYGGTWIAMHENRNVAVFLNGGFDAHQPAPPYRRSRGLILLDLLDHVSPFRAFVDTGLENIEPFTAVLYDNGTLFECRWDGRNKHRLELSPHEPHIWSSCTLYPRPVIEKREQWFSNWLSAISQPSMEDIIGFHRSAGDGDLENDITMNRGGLLQTVSITSVEVAPARSVMRYLDLKSGRDHLFELNHEPTMQER